jgi:hypothetical protein
MPVGAHGGSFDKMIVPEAANMPPTPWQTEILAPGADEANRLCREVAGALG